MSRKVWLSHAGASVLERAGKPHLCMFGAAIMVVVYSQLDDPPHLLVGGAVMGFFVNGMLGGYGTLMSGLYPTAARATAQNVFFNIGTGGAGFGPLAIGAVSAVYGFQTAIALLAFALHPGHCRVVAADTGTEGCGVGLKLIFRRGRKALFVA